jgi:hypothetical protein
MYSTIGLAIFVALVYAKDVEHVIELSSRKKASLFYNGKKLQIAGGIDASQESSASDQLYTYDLELNETTKTEYKVLKRMGHTVTTLESNKNLVLFGAVTDDETSPQFPDEPMVQIESIDDQLVPTTNMQKIDVPPNRHGHSATFVNHKGIIVYGGYIKPSDSRTGYSAIDNSLYQLDTKTFNWTKLSQNSVHSRPRAYHNAFAPDGKFVLVTCFGQGPNSVIYGDCSAMSLDTGRELAPKIHHESSLYPVPPRAYASMSVTANDYNRRTVILYGGCNIGNGSFFEDVIEVSVTVEGDAPPVLLWNKLETTGKGPGPRCQHTSLISDNRLIIWGGMLSNFSDADPDIYVLDLTTREWVDKSVLLKGSSKMVQVVAVSCGFCVIFVLCCVYRRRREVGDFVSQGNSLFIMSSEKKRKSVMTVKSGTSTTDNSDSSEDLLNDTAAKSDEREGVRKKRMSLAFLGLDPSSDTEDAHNGDGYGSGKFATIGGRFFRRNRRNSLFAPSPPSPKCSKHPRTVNALTLHQLPDDLTKVDKPRKTVLLHNHITYFFTRFYRTTTSFSSSPFKPRPRSSSTGTISANSVESLQWVNWTSEQVALPRTALTVRNRTSLDIQMESMDLTDPLKDFLPLPYHAQS